MSRLRYRYVPDFKTIGKLKLTTRQIALTMAQAALDVKAEHVVVLDLRKISYSFDFFLISTASSARMLKTVIESIDEAVSEKEVQPLHREGKPESGWLLLDCGAVVAHAFLPEARQFYDLERMWADAPRLKIPKK